MEQPKKNFKIVSDKKARTILPNAITLKSLTLGTLVDCVDFKQILI